MIKAVFSASWLQCHVILQKLNGFILTDDGLTVPALCRRLNHQRLNLHPFIILVFLFYHRGQLCSTQLIWFLTSTHTHRVMSSSAVISLTHAHAHPWQTLAHTLTHTHTHTEWWALLLWSLSLSHTHTRMHTHTHTHTHTHSLFVFLYEVVFDELLQSLAVRFDVALQLCVIQSADLVIVKLLVKLVNKQTITDCLLVDKIQS